MGIGQSAVAVVFVVLSGCNSRPVTSSDAMKVNEYCAKGQSQANIDLGRALIDNFTKSVKDPIEKELFKKRMKILKDNCGDWPKKFPGIPTEPNDVNLLNLYDSIELYFSTD